MRSLLAARGLAFAVAAVFALGFVLASAAAVDAAPTRTFRQATAKDFEEGEATASLILPDGFVVPGMKPAAVELEAAFAWCAALSPDGRTAYFGSGDEGRIYAVDVDGTRAGKDGGGKARRLASLDAAWVTALAVRADGTLLAGTTPGGQVWSVDPRTGNARPFATLGTDHVWALALDPKTGVAYAGTGGPGKIVAIDPGGKLRDVWNSGDKHVVSLIQADDQHLYAGTSDRAILFRVGFDGRAEALADFDADEVRALARSGGALYAAVNDFEHTSSSPAPQPAGPHGTRITVSPGSAPSSAGSLPRPGQRKAKAALYRLDGDGRMEQVFAIADGYFTAIAFDEQGRAFVGTGTDGRVYRVAADRTAALAIDLPERQVLALLRSGQTFLVGTGDVGGVYRVAAAAARQASYLSRVLDGQWSSRWGMFRWQGTHALSVETRSGNTSRPDATWSAYALLARPHPTADGGAGWLASPAARYVQYRVTFGGGDDRLGAVTLAYLPQNQRPRVTEVTVGDAAAASAGGGLGAFSGLGSFGSFGSFGSSGSSGAFGSLGSLGSTTPTTAAPTRAHSSLIKLRWKAENPDGDDLDYRLAFRQEAEAAWRPLGGPDPLSDTRYDWNTEGLPDGTYVVRVTASDEHAEPRDRVLEASLTSAPILVDNRKPEVVGLVAKYPFLSGRARDDQSPLTSLEYAVDGGDWQALAPTDGLCDDLVEAFTFRLPAVGPGPHALTVRAWDSADNVGAASVTVNGPPAPGARPR